jgi:hypothetical protein
MTKYLDLADNSITDAGAIALADSPYLTNLEYLSLWGNELKKKGEDRLRERFGDVYTN